jgi:hypothetical protein
MAGFPRVCALPPCWDGCRIICWNCYTGSRPCRLRHSPCCQYTITSCCRSQNIGHREHVCWRHLPKYAQRSPCSLHPTATVCRPAPIVFRTTLTVFHPSTTAIFCAAATKLYHLCCPQLHRPPTRAKMSFQWMSSNDQGLPRSSRLHQLWPLQKESSKQLDSPLQQCLDSVQTTVIIQNTTQTLEYTKDKYNVKIRK